MNKEVLMYDPLKHKNQLIRWNREWKWNYPIDLLPETGVIIEDICAIFLYETNSNLCFVESFICNPTVPVEERDDALDKVVDVLLHLAKEKGFTHIMGYTKHKKVSERAERHGFLVGTDNYKAFYRSL